MTPPAPDWVRWVAAIILALLIIRGAWRGYQRGPLGQLALGVGWVWGPETGHYLLAGTNFPWLLRGAAG